MGLASGARNGLSLRIRANSAKTVIRQNVAGGGECLPTFLTKGALFDLAL